MQRQEIEQYLQELGDELEVQGFEMPVRVMVVGGVAMLFLAYNRESTEDVDVVLMDIEGDSSTNPTPETKAFKSAVHAVAKRYKMKRTWINDDVAYFIRDMAPNPEASLWRAFKKLHVYLPSKEYILALKLMVYRQKDMSDIEALLKQLNVETREQAQAIVDHFIPDDAYKEHYQIEDTLDELF
ncbi:DUF6036 family nucleotidyltransferase [Dictyobacter arantiisoli]|uniref:DUF6036 domain-containing protein n=1 Tax=Dictyobacter arantiisoli TaxID=2014874 RepID=A0A5A5TBL7_9CHLR|nr:DUF6036 family nucleotidyltransferase [Dictyobacter arantiisoli]GCF08399.1 hypothetical protein KDI_19630 [Dictyobacter arantiisoli]